ncbi:VapB-type antitoxin [Sulfurisphaera ohwakuensis]|uniref:Putative CopG family antitoxin n=1 Tax=Sulfurisphaera ohwakuensis TaxID=69656 RepID=A0A650CER9_SULOH|nr:VapB-type antitoxin [Sulfurisphaera ohwakuensis]MBB5254414.1 putative CopG family antitoxin [Sulfurisphaera ohwakuensis]QGR16341.1 VapB-type antitoxin [Sulfurisphaera ohwakuensis]
MKSTISVSKEIKELLERKKKEMEIKLDKPLTWDEFFQEVFKEENAPTLTEEEAETLKKLVLEDRKNWKVREFA